MTDLADEFAQYCKLAVESAAKELGVPPLALARRLNQAEIARLVHLLNAAQQHVPNGSLRHRIEDLLSAVTDGRLPSQEPESELDWALKMVRRRKARQGGDEPGLEQPEP